MKSTVACSLTCKLASLDYSNNCCILTLIYPPFDPAWIHSLALLFLNSLGLQNYLCHVEQQDYLTTGLYTSWHLLMHKSEIEPLRSLVLRCCNVSHLFFGRQSVPSLIPTFVPHNIVKFCNVEKHNIKATNSQKNLVPTTIFQLS